MISLANYSKSITHAFRLWDSKCKPLDALADISTGSQPRIAPIPDEA
jgi:RNAse (barnase) inhibitor barstar